ncbi:hypothetical protein K1T71_008489 [Dendrolimus kikuchii]|uniref:Uncharacterized protein n=1 Tax=Dendrolimus kikuchii TaxID=765133 RepID=A0ACC1CXW4_9NEOP|nr:hypothetical protein K1T71_008489 [Dendrolimus kikuchii]
MDYLPTNPVLQFNVDTMEEIRKLYDLDNPARLEEALQILEDWIEKQNHFTEKKFDKAYLERVLIVAKGSVERAKSLMDNMCTFRTLLPKYFIASNLREELNSILWAVPLPKMTKDHDRVYVVKVNTVDIQPQDFITYCRWNIITCEYLKLHDYIRGIILIQDSRDIKLLDLIMKLSLTELQEIMTIILKGFGASLKQIHFINDTKLLDYILLLGKQFVSNKLLSRIKYHANAEALLEYIDPSILPVELGGTERSLNTIRDEWIDVLSSEDHIKYMRTMNEARTDETQRLEESFNSLHMGTPGSFRNLVVD